MSEQISFERLVDWIEGRLSSEEAAKVAVLVENADAEMQQTAAWLRTFNRVSQQTTLLPPENMRQRLVAHFATWAAARKQSQPGLWQRLQAALTFDSGSQLGLAGARNAGLETSQRQLIYSSEAGDITLFVQERPFDSHLDLNGQVFPNSAATDGILTVQLLADGQEVEATVTDDLFEFAFTAVPRQSYTLTIRSHQTEIAVNPLDLTQTS